MPIHKRRGPIPRRRRHDDDGDEDNSNLGDAQDYASSEASATTDAEEDGDVSVVSVEDGALPTPLSVVPKQDSRSTQDHHFETTAENDAMLNGLKGQDGEIVEELSFDGSAKLADSAASPQQPQSTEPRDLSMRHTGRTANQSTPPIRKSHFHSDERPRGPAAFNQPVPRGRGRGFPGLNARGNFGSFNVPNHETSKQWTHDLHETVNKPPSTNSTGGLPQTYTSPHTAPNRSFSTTTVLGNVPVQVSIPGVDKKTSASMVKKHYTLLPQHRPPLRRDKPVRISIPDEHPRYIFPSTERSFIFIPRAMRPNQHQFKGRGRGSFHGSRRTSLYGGSVYTPSIGMSRRPSLVASQPGSGIHTPTGPQQQQSQPAASKPVVRLPVPGMVPFVPASQSTEVYLGDNSAIVHSPPATLPMHQPVPQKAVSVADIESPTLKAPPQQSQQPFHQQIPQSIGDPQQKMPHIPEGAVFAQPFQPHLAMQPGFYAMPYLHTSAMMQPPDNMGYAVSGPIMNTMQPSSGQPHQQQQVPVAHEQSGMVYYLDPYQQQMQPNFAPQMMNMNMMQSGPYYYPPIHNQHMFYQ